MQVWDNDVQAVYKLFTNLCAWASQRGLNDVSAMKELLKLAMVNVYLERHQDKSPHKAHLAAAMDLGISVRNIEKCLKATQKLNNSHSGLSGVPQIIWNIIQLLNQRSHSFAELLDTVPPEEGSSKTQQHEALLSILAKLEETGFIKAEIKKGERYYLISPALVYFFDMDNLVRLLSLVMHIEAYENVVTESFFKVYYMDCGQIEAVRRKLHEHVFEVLDVRGQTSHANDSIRRYYSTIYGFGRWGYNRPPNTLADVILRFIKLRFTAPSSLSGMRTSMNYLTPEYAQVAFTTIRSFIEQLGQMQPTAKERPSHHPVVFYLGMTGAQPQLFPQVRGDYSAIA
jgi:hypothetical protein